MKFKMALTMMALAGAVFAATPASAVVVGASGQSVKADVVTQGLVEQVRHRRWRGNRLHYRNAYRYRYRPYAYSYQPYYYRRPYYSPYYSSYYSPYYASPYYGGYYGRRRGGFSIQFGF